MKKIFVLIQVAIFISLPTLFLQAQDKKTEPSTKQIIEEQNYVFRAETANPQQGRLRQLTSEYDVVVTRDTVVSYLPYFGRAYSAPITLNDGGIKFTSTKFDYKSEQKKKDRWEISITPKDASDVQQLQLTVFENGRASLRVTSLNRQSISFNGYVVEGSIRAKKGF